MDLFPYSDDVIDIVKSNEKRVSASTDNSVGMRKVVRSDDCEVTVQGKTTDHRSREILKGRFIALSSCSFVKFPYCCRCL